MKKILIIDDDPMVLTTYAPKFSSAGYEVQTARDGEEGLAKIESFRPDLIHLDLMLPKFNGVEIIRVLRAHEEWRHTPILVLSVAYNTDMLQEAWKAGATLCLSKHDTTPSIFFDTVQRILAAAERPREQAGDRSRGTRKMADMLTRSLESSQLQLREEFMTLSGQLRDEIGDKLRGYSEASDRKRKTLSLAGLSRSVHKVTGHAGLAGYQGISHLAGALEVLITVVITMPERLTPSSTKTIFYGAMCLQKMIADVTADQKDDMSGNLVLAVDDDPVSLEALSSALSRAGLKPICISNPTVALQVLAQNTFDLIFLDIEMPGLSGLAVCRNLRAMATNTDTPVIFVTGLTDFEVHQKADLCGGNDLIAKPFLAAEVAVKALVFRFRSRPMSFSS